jgi:lipopolysaccharide heptosyltransferase II
MTESLDSKISSVPDESDLLSDRHLRILVVRPDRLGDVILSTPVFEVIKRHYSNAHLTVMVKESIIPVLKGLPCVDHFMTFEPEGRHAGIKGFFRLYTEIRRRHYRIAITLQSNWKIAAALFLAGVRYRVGPFSKFHSYLFYNRGIRQRRSHVEMHETDYNLQLLRKLGIRVGSRNVETRVHISDEVKADAQKWLLQMGWNQAKKLIVVHPGMGGSALNWPESHYHELIYALAKEGHQVLVTGGPTEVELLNRIEQQLIQTSSGYSVFFHRSPNVKTVDYLAALFSFGDVVVAPSTGPLHVAVALGKPVVSFYPPIRVQSALRWGPYLPDESRASVLVPEFYCGQDFKCLGSLCNYFPCMKSISAKRALDEVNRQLSHAPSSTP